MVVAEITVGGKRGKDTGREGWRNLGPNKNAKSRKKTEPPPDPLLWLFLLIYYKWHNRHAFLFMCVHSSCDV